MNVNLSSESNIPLKIFVAIPRPNGPSWTEPKTAGRGHNNKPESHNSHWTTKGAVSTRTTTTDPGEGEFAFY